MEGPALFYRTSGKVQLIDLSDSGRTYGLFGSPALEEIKRKGIFVGIPEDCLIVVYGVRAEVRIAKKQSIYATKLDLVRLYTRKDLDSEIKHIEIEALEDSQVCPSA